MGEKKKTAVPARPSLLLGLKHGTYLGQEKEKKKNSLFK